MAAPKVHPFWQEAIRRIHQGSPGLSDHAILLMIEKLPLRPPEARKVPSESSIARIRRAFRSLPELERVQYSEFHWPGSMGSADLPWESSPYCLELLRFMHPGGRPLMRVVKWFVRICLAAPDAPFGSRVKAATHFAALEALDKLSSKEARLAETYLCYAPWRSEANALAYQRVAPETGVGTKECGVPVPSPFGVAIPVGTDPGIAKETVRSIYGFAGMAEALEELRQGGPSVIKGRAKSIRVQASPSGIAVEPDPVENTGHKKSVGKKGETQS